MHGIIQQIVLLLFITIKRNVKTLQEIVIKGMEHVPNIFMSFDKYLFLEMINILI